MATPQRRLGDGAMLGPGGELVEPVSEGAALGQFVRQLLHAVAKATEHPQFVTEHRALLNEVNDVVVGLRQLQKQVERGYHRNPKHKFLAGHAVERMSGNVHELRYTHDEDGDNYKHDFRGDVEMWAVRRGDRRDILLTHKRGQPLWEDF